MRGVTTTTPAQQIRPEAHPMLLVDCPLCDVPAPFDDERDALDCPACNVRLELVPDRDRLELAAAA